MMLWKNNPITFIMDKVQKFKKYLAEFIGTFALVFFGTGAIIVDHQTGGELGLVGISLAFGLIITAMIYVFGSISGAHINPAITVALYIKDKLNIRSVVLYIIFQILGAIVASFLLKTIFPTNISLGITLPNGTSTQSFLVEIISTYFLTLTIIGLASQKDKTIRALSGIIIGFVIIALIQFAGPVSGGSFNPARSIGPAIASNNFNSLWIYISAPIIGSISAVLSWKIVSH